MSEIFYFNQGDYEGADICGEDYRELINYCFKHCTAFSFSFHSKESESYLGNVTPFFEKSLLPEDYTGKNGIIWLQHKNIYFCNEQLRSLLLQNVQSLFDWKLSGNKAIPEPEDLCFYRQDGSGMFWSCTHEGECVFYPRDEEERPNFILRYGWEMLKPEHPYYEGFAMYRQKFSIYE